MFSIVTILYWESYQRIEFAHLSVVVLLLNAISLKIVVVRLAKLLHG